MKPLLLFVDADLPDNITDGTYNPETRDATGKAGNAYRTLGEGIDAVKANGTVLVRVGTYAELQAPDACFVIDKDVTISAYEQEEVTITYDEPPAGPGQIIRVLAEDVTLEGLTIIGTRDLGDGETDADVSVLSLSNTGVTVRHCTFLKWGHCAIKRSMAIVEECKFGPGGFTYNDHHIYISRPGPAVIRHNVMDGAAGYAVHLYPDPDYCDVYGNVIYGCGAGGIVVAGSDHNIVNNTVIDNGERGIFLFHYGLNRIAVYNNISRQHSTFDLTVDGELGEGCTFGNNNYQAAEPECQGDGDNQDDPHFVSENPQTWYDYRLSPDSPLVGAGRVSDWSGLDPSVTDWPTPESGPISNIGAFATK